MAKYISEQVLDLVREQKGLIHRKDLEKRGIPTVYLTRLVRQGKLKRVTRGLYLLADMDADALSDIEGSSFIACMQVPEGVLCLLSALQYHDMTTQLPHEVWMAIPAGSWKKKIDYPNIRYFRFSGQSMREGVATRTTRGYELKFFNPAKTVADCFKFRNKIGLDVAIEALRDGWRNRRFTIDELWRNARVCRVENVIRPYVESLQ